MRSSPTTKVSNRFPNSVNAVASNEASLAAVTLMSRAANPESTA